jgi:imidazolonepropionase-like amidohydrolase
VTSYLFSGGRFLDPRKDELQDGISVLVEDGAIKEVSDRPIVSSTATRIDLRGRTLMPGLIDCHIHVVLAEVNLRLLADVPLTLLAAKGSVAMRAMLHRGFTTVRDTGGADWGIKAAVEQGLFEGPRLFIAGQPLSQTGGHADHRLRTQDREFCACCSGLSWTARVADGLPEVIKATRDELRKGADHIKLMVSGALPHRPIRWRACNSGWMRSRRRWRRRPVGAAMSARMPTRPRRSSGRSTPASARSSMAT